MEYGIKEDTDITKWYLQKVLDQEAKSLGDLARCLKDIHIDRVVQAFIDQELVRVDTPDRAMFQAGQVDMGIKIKRLLSNLSNISRRVADTGEVGDIEDILNPEGISKKDLALLNKG